MEQTFLLLQKVINLSDEYKKWIDELSRYFEENRINAVLLKGDVQFTWKQFGKLSGLFFKDTLDDFLKDNPEFIELEKEKRKLIQNFARVQAQDFVREFMKKHV